MLSAAAISPPPTAITEGSTAIARFATCIARWRMAWSMSSRAAGSVRASWKIRRADGSTADEEPADEASVAEAIVDGAPAGDVSVDDVAVDVVAVDDVTADVATGDDVPGDAMTSVMWAPRSPIAFPLTTSSKGARPACTPSHSASASTRL